MKAVLLKKFGGTDELYIGDVPKPKLKDGGIIIRVEASGVNRADIQQRMGRYPPPEGESDILGLEMYAYKSNNENSGVVEDVDSNVKNWRIGDRVMALLSGGGYAEYVSIPASLAIPMPANLSFEQAAGITETFITTYQALFWLGNIQPNQHVLFHGGASGIGISAIQLAKTIPGVHVSVTAGSDAKCQACLDLGADFAWNYKNGLFEKPVLEATGGVDFILDFIGKDYFIQNLNLLNEDGRLVFLAMLSGTKCDGVPLGTILRKRLSIIGTTLRSRSLDYRSKLIQEFTDKIIPKFENGEIKPHIDKVYPLSEVASAHKVIEENANIGKLILKVGE